VNYKDEIGNTHGLLQVVKFSHIAGSGQAMWECLCRCGNTTVVQGSGLRNGHVRSCGCSRREDLVNRVFGRLTAIKPTRANRKSGWSWECLCECGKTKVVLAASLLRGSVQSCGCLSRDLKYLGYKDVSMTYFSSLKRGARLRNLPFEVTIEQIWDLFVLQDKKCALTGDDIEFTDYITATASLDRIDSTKGYLIDNIQWVHKDINVLKMAWPEDKLISMCTKISEHYKVTNQGERSELAEIASNIL